VWDAAEAAEVRMSRSQVHDGRRGLRRRGSAILELSLTLSILLSLTFGAIEFGHFFFVKQTLQGAARQGARAAIPAAATNAEVTEAVNNSLTAAGFNTANYTVRIRNAADTADVNVASQTVGTGILVKVSGTWGTVGIRPLAMLATTKQVTGAAVMRKEAA
jgi:Flp pilus assembly protein TadG